MSSSPSDWYILDKYGKPVPSSPFGHQAWMEEHPGAHVLCQNLLHGLLFSTVFLGLDHGSCPERGPVLWETMVLDRRYEEQGRPAHPWHQFQMRYRAKDHALRGHAYVLERYRMNAYAGDVWEELAEAVEQWETGTLPEAHG